ncbi:RelE family toxin-antitoxin system [Klebsiella pneumoniae]|nr:RelE family toxin-antitoxin system [Klebsiella pneumoniae]
MTGITELVQRLKLEVHRAVSDFNPQMNIKTRDLKELVEALEKAQAKADVYDMLRDDYGLREKGVGLTCFVDWQAKRIAELESRTVKLPDLRQIVSGDRYVWSDGVYNYSQDVKVALAAAGIKVEAE